jgi:hypothetical protein
MHDREPVGQALNYIIRALDVVVELANDPATYDEVAGEEVALWRIKCRIELLTSLVKEKQDEIFLLKVVQ